MKNKRELYFLELRSKRRVKVRACTCSNYVWGLDHVSSLGGFYYYAIVIDDATRTIGFISFP